MSGGDFNVCLCFCAERFQPTERSDWRKTSDQMDNMSDFQHVQSLWTTREVSIRVHESFRSAHWSQTKKRA